MFIHAHIKQKNAKLLRNVILSASARSQSPCGLRSKRVVCLQDIAEERKTLDAAILAHISFGCFMFVTSLHF